MTSMLRSHFLAGGQRSCRAAAAIAAALLAAPSAVAQSGLAKTLNPLSADSNGIHLYSVSIYDGYYSSPQAFTNTPSSGGLDLKPDMGLGVSAAFGFNYVRSGTGISVNYTPAYNAFWRYSNFSALNHSFAIVIHNRHDPARKWHTDFSADANASTTMQTLFSPGSLAQLADAPLTFDELTQGVVAGRYTNDQIASLLTGASLPQSPAEISLFGDYYLAAALQARVSYAHSSRFTVSMAVSGRRFESLPRNGTDTNSPHLLPNSTTVTGAVQMGYSLSSRTQLRFDIASTRAVSRLSDGYNNSATVSLSRVISRRWFAEGNIGGANGIVLRYAAATPADPQLIGGGSIGIKTETHTIMAQSSLTRQDPYGLGTRSTIVANLAWSWRPRSNGWSALVDGGWQRMNLATAPLSDGWTGRASLTRALTRSTGMTLAFGYLSAAGPLADVLSRRALRSLVLSIHWVPRGEKTRGAVQ